jgi:hypothetical protein
MYSLTLIFILTIITALALGSIASRENSRDSGGALKDIKDKRGGLLGFASYDRRGRLTRLTQMIFLFPRQIVSSITYRRRGGTARKIVLRRGKAIIESNRDGDYFIKVRNSKGKYSLPTLLKSVKIDSTNNAVTYTQDVGGKEVTIVYDIYQNDKNEFLSLLSMVFNAERYRRPKWK